ncbi:MbcA/ParS/Xre antitoxin family protein [Noviherbaspirillum aerium]|uniref:MbcA/ParS/Xre antitoxin family protein n=1 Tax=Noviherbaspirillum aerium TaxID=2588497 RepID=UPI00124D80CC|nr:MbcA/ParS/Xre antitoxin family protein [Noviherbaspirillum aerium]
MNEIDDLITLVRRMVRESGNPARFDAAAWVAEWVQRPLSALGGQTPANFLKTAEGRQVIKQLLASTQSGAYF